MNRIDAVLGKNLREGRKSLILFLTAGDPDLKTTEELIPRLFDSGADVVEIGIPFSDPLADGPTIQESFTRALKKGVNLKDILAMAGRVRKKTDKPLVFMSAYNLIFQYGLERFALDAARSGIDGVILPDLIPEEATSIRPLLKKAGIHTIFLAAPTSGRARIGMITRASGGFVYYISVKGITGQKKPDTKEIGEQVSLIRESTKLPIACGFGISTPEQAAEIAKIVDGVIIGSAFVKELGKKGPKVENIGRGLRFVSKVRKALDRV